MQIKNLQARYSCPDNDLKMNDGKEKIIMEIQFNRFFITHTIFVSIGTKYYKLNREDLSMEEVSELPIQSKEDPIMVLHKIQFDIAKGYLLDVQNPFRVSLGTAEIYNKIGFLSDDEFKAYKEKFEKFEAERLRLYKITIRNSKR